MRQGAAAGKALLLLAAVLVMGSTATGIGPAAASSASRWGAAILDPEVRELVRLVNARRVAAGCPPLAWSRRAAAVAEAHSRDMAARGYFGHDDPDGTSPFDRLEHAGMSFRKAGENIAAGHATGESVFHGWVGSRRHRRNLDDCAFTHHGVGRFQNRWTHVLLRPAPGANQ